MQRAYTRFLTDRHPPRVRLWLGVFATGLLGACSVSSPLAITSSGNGLEPGRSVALGESEDEGGLRARFRSALADAFAQATSDPSEQAPVFAEFSVSQTDASDGIAKGKVSGAEDSDTPDWIATPRRQRNFDECNAQRVRASMVLYDRASGEILYRGTGQATACDFSDADLAEAAKALVDDALARSQR